MSTAPMFDDDGDFDIDFDALDAALEAIEVSRAPRDPDAERTRLRELGAPAWAFLDLSAVHHCVSNDDGVCGRCVELGEVVS